MPDTKFAAAFAAIFAVSRCADGNAFAQSQPGYTFQVTVRSEAGKK